MKQYLDRAVTVIRGVVAGVQSDRITFLAASLAYYAFVSLLPLLLLALAATSMFGHPELFEALVDEVATALGDQAGGLLEEALTNATGRGGATFVGFVVLLWSGLKLFRGLDIAFSAVYDDPGPESIFEQIRNAIVTLGTVALGVAGTVAIGAAIAFVDTDVVVEGYDVVQLAGSLLLVVGLAAAFLPLYYFLPGVGVSVREALPGAIFAAIGWTLLQIGFRIYAAHAGNYEAYGVLGGALLLVAFLYFGALILLIGGVLNAVVADRSTADSTAHRDDSTTEPTAVLEGIMTRDRLDDDASDAELREELERLYDELDRFEERIDDRTVHREELERDLRRYVRTRVRRGKARGWGPYLVLLYGTAMTLGAFFFLSSGWAILAMLVIWLSTLGLYVLMLLVGTTVTIAGLPGRLKDRFESR